MFFSHISLFFFLIGLVSLTGQVVIIRELSVAFYGVELIYILAIGIWLFSSAAGAITARRTRRLYEQGHFAVFIFFAISLISTIFFLRSIFVFFAGIKGTYLPFYAQITGLFLAIAPSAFLMGVAFQWVAQRYICNFDSTNEPDKPAFLPYSLAKAYAVECAGCVAGGLLATVSLALEVQNLTLSLWCAFFCCIPGFVAAKRYKMLFVFMAFLVLGTIFFSQQINIVMTSLQHPNLLFTKDTPYGRIHVSKLHDQYAIFENNTLSFETEGVGAEEFVHLPCLQVEPVHAIVALGGGMDGTLTEALKHKPDSVLYTELNPSLIKDVLPVLPEQLRIPLNDPKIEIVLTDPRLFLEKTSKKFDVILIGIPEPESAQTNRFYSKEFFKLCKDKLKPTGVIAFRLRAGDAIWTTELAKRNVSIIKAAQMAFNSVQLLPGSPMLVIAGDSLVAEPELLWQRFQERKIDSVLLSKPYFFYMYDNNKLAEVQKEMLNIGAPVNSDSKPVCYRYAINIWLSKFFPALLSKQGESEPSVKKQGIRILDNISLTENSFIAITLSCIFVFMLPVAAFHILSRRLQDIFGMFLVSAAGTGLEGVLILAYQVKNGVLYQDIGLLEMLFMLGMSIGAWAMEKNSYVKNFVFKTQGMAFVASFLANATITGFLVASLSLQIGFMIGVLLFWTGFNVSVYFAYLTMLPIWQKNAKKAVSPLYASDLAGGGVATLAVSLFAVPMLGLAWTTVLMGAVMASLLLQGRK